MSIGGELLRYNKAQKYLLFDMESCHLNTMVDNLPWQISWLVFNQNEVFENHNYYINWGNKIKVSKGAAEITGYDAEFVRKNGKPPEEVYKKFIEYINNLDYKICGHNIFSFDLLVLSILARELGYKEDYSCLNRVYDTNCLAKAIKNGIKPDRDNILGWQMKLCGFFKKGIKTSLGVLSREYNLDIDESRLHQSDYDLILNKQIFLKQIWEIEI